jgi:hypothetical protein
VGVVAVRARNGEFAVVDGVTWPCRYLQRDDKVVLRSKAEENPGPGVFEWNERFVGWIAQLPSARCDRVYATQTFARYQGHRVAVLAVDGASASVRYADANGAWAAENGFSEVDKYEYTKDVAVAELRDVVEEQADLLFDAWRAAGFAVPEGVQVAGWRP